MKRFVKMFDREQVGFDRWQAVVFAIVIVAIPAMFVASAYIPVSSFAGDVTIFFCLYLLLLDEVHLGLSVIYTRRNWRQYLKYLGVSFMVLFLLLFLIIAPLLV